MINKVIEGKDEKIVEDSLKANRKPPADPHEKAELYKEIEDIIDNPPEPYPAKMKGNPKRGQKVFQQIADEITGEHQNASNLTNNKNKNNQDNI